MQARRGIGFRPRALRHGMALLVAGAAMAACEVEMAPTAPEPGLAPAPGVVLAADADHATKASTEAGIGVTESGAEVVRMTFRAELQGVPPLPGSDVVVTWEQAGGVEPSPFVVAIPAGCFRPDRDRLRVVDFRRCGVRADAGGRALPLLAFEAVMGVAPDDGAAALLRIRAVMGVTPDDSAPALLGALGGAVVEVAIGAASGGAPPLAVETVSGVDPSPFLTASALALSGARTRARAGETDAGAGTVGLGFEAALDGRPALAGADVVVTWEQAGGIDPSPFLVAIPAGCFVRGRRVLRVVDFRGCGVRAGAGGRALPLLAFEAVMGVTPDDGAPALLRIRAVMGVTPDDGAPALLGALGGAVVEVAIGPASGGAPPLRVQTLSGVDPTPF